MRSGFPISPTAGGVRLRLRVQPRASREELAGLAGGAIRIRLTAPPVDGAANEALVRFLASRLEVSRSAVELVGGYGVRVRWSDGHSTGIYTFELLRAICPCEQCATP